MGSPQNPSEDPSAGQYQQLKVAGQLESLESPRWIAVERNMIELKFVEPPQGLSMLDLT
jgi:hypothetical protein